MITQREGQRERAGSWTISCIRKVVTIRVKNIPCYTDGKFIKKVLI